MLRPGRTVDPGPLLDFAEVKRQLRIDTADDDALVTSLIGAAVSYLDGWAGILGRALVTQTWAQSFSCFSGAGIMRLPLAPVQSIASITYRDSDDVEQVLAGSDYLLLADDLGDYVARPRDVSWPSTYSRADAVTIAFLAGYGDADAVPAAIKHAALLMIGVWYETRESVVIGQSAVDVPYGANVLLAPFRRTKF